MSVIVSYSHTLLYYPFTVQRLLLTFFTFYCFIFFTLFKLRVSTFLLKMMMMMSHNIKPHHTAHYKCHIQTVTTAIKYVSH